jgi:hypothetical protein
VWFRGSPFFENCLRPFQGRGCGGILIRGCRPDASGLYPRLLALTPSASIRTGSVKEADVTSALPGIGLRAYVECADLSALWSAVASVARHRFGSTDAGSTKAPSSLRFAGALQMRFALRAQCGQDARAPLSGAPVVAGYLGGGAFNPKLGI